MNMPTAQSGGILVNAAMQPWMAKSTQSVALPGLL